MRDGGEPGKAAYNFPVITRERPSESGKSTYEYRNAGYQLQIAHHHYELSDPCQKLINLNKPAAFYLAKNNIQLLSFLGVSRRREAEPLGDWLIKCSFYVVYQFVHRIRASEGVFCRVVLAVRVAGWVEAKEIVKKKEENRQPGSAHEANDYLFRFKR